MLLQLLFVLVAIIIGARVGGIGLGILGGLGLAVLTFVFGLQPTAPPIDVMLMIVAVIAAASCMQAAGGLDLMVKWAEKILRKNPHHITLLSPFVTYFFTFFAGTGHVAYSVLPVIAEVAKDTGFRIQCRNAGCSCHLWYRMDGRYLYCRKHGSDEREHLRSCYRYTLAVWCSLVPDVHSVVQSGSYRSFPVTTRHSTGHLSLHAYRTFPGSERLFFPAQLPDGDSRHKL